MIWIIFFSLALIGIGVLCLVRPEMLWPAPKPDRGRAERADTAEILTILPGSALVIAGLVLFILAL